MPRNPSGDAGSKVVPSSTSTGGSARSGGPKRPPRPSPSSGGAATRSTKQKQKQRKTPAAKGGAAGGRPAKKPTSSGDPGKDATAASNAPSETSSTEATTTTTASPPPGFVGADATRVEPQTAATRPPSKQRAPRTRAAEEPVVERTTGGRRGRRVTRVVRRIELWSVLKLSLVLFTCMYLAVLGTLVVVWGVAYSSGQVERLQEFLADVGLENFRFYGDRMFKAVAAMGAVVVLAGTILAVLTTALINVISEMTGGIRVVVIEEERPPRR